MKYLKYFKESTEYDMDEIFVEVLDEDFKFWDGPSDKSKIYLKRKITNINNVVPKMPKYNHSLSKEESDRIFSKYASHKEAQLGRWIIEAVAIDKEGKFEGMLWGNVWRRDSYKDVPEEQYRLYKKTFDACVAVLHYRNDKYIDLKIHSIPAGTNGIVTEATQVITISFEDTITKENPFKQV